LEPVDVATSNVDPELVYTNISGFGLIKSLNGGNTWQELGVHNSSMAPGARPLALDPFRPSRVYYEQLCEGAPLCFSYSTDAGSSWQQAPMPVPVTYTGWMSRLNVIAPHPLVSGTLYASVQYSKDGVDSAAFYRSHDYGESWGYIGPNVAISEVIDVAFDGGDPDLMYAATDGQGLWRSTDSGESWVHLPISDTQPPVTVPAIATHPEVSRKLYLRTYSFADSPNPEPELWVSEDAGDSWQPMAYAFLGVDLLVAPPVPDAGPYTLYTGCVLGLCVSSDDGQSWEPYEGAPRPEILAAGTGDGRAVVYLGSPGGLVTSAGSSSSTRGALEEPIPGRGSVLGGGVYRLTTLLPRHREYLPLVLRVYGAP
jgi:hypothetical protein